MTSCNSEYFYFSSIFPIISAIISGVLVFIGSSFLDSKRNRHDVKKRTDDWVSKQILEILDYMNAFAFALMDDSLKISDLIRSPTSYDVDLDEKIKNEDYYFIRIKSRVNAILKYEEKVCHALKDTENMLLEYKRIKLKIFDRFIEDLKNSNSQKFEQRNDDLLLELNKITRNVHQSIDALEEYIISKQPYKIKI